MSHQARWNRRMVLAYRLDNTLAEMRKEFHLSEPTCIGYRHPGKLSYTMARCSAALR